MNLNTILHQDYETKLPQSGRHILAQERGDNIIVYQAFNPNIVRYAIEHQQFGGPYYSFSRMSWIKPNFLWMMYRAGWAGKEHQQHILAIEIEKVNFFTLLSEAVHSSFNPIVYEDRDSWKEQVANSEVRLQWDPDHGPRGGKLERRAIQLGLRGTRLKEFATDWIVSIEDITPFVKEQKQLLDENRMDEFKVIDESVINIDDQRIIDRLGLDPFEL